MPFTRPRRIEFWISFCEMLALAGRPSFLFINDEAGKPDHDSSILKVARLRKKFNLGFRQLIFRP